MRENNVKEYELLRTEVETVKKCMTDYTGYVLGGSGIAVLGLAAVYQVAEIPGGITVGVAFGCLTMSVLISLVFLILVYKFNSHNRFAGYGRLLAHESWIHKGEVGDAEHVMAWEFCVALLRDLEYRPAEWWEICEAVEPHGKPLKEISSDHPKYSDLYRDPDLKSKVRALVSSMFGMSKSRSWSFPPHITALFAWIVFGFWLAGMTLLAQNVFSLDRPWQLIPSAINALVAYAVIITVGELFLWLRFGSRLHSLMQGRATVDSYFWRFLPLRAYFLSKYFVVPEYLGVNAEKWQEYVEKEAKRFRGNTAERSREVSE